MKAINSVFFTRVTVADRQFGVFGRLGRGLARASLCLNRFEVVDVVSWRWLVGVLFFLLCSMGVERESRGRFGREQIKYLTHRFASDKIRMGDI